MTWEELKETQKYGTLALHGYEHNHLTQLSIQEVYEDTQKGINLFQSHLGYKPTSYAYAYGEYNEEVKDTISQFGFSSIVNQNSGSVITKKQPFRYKPDCSCR